RQPKYGECRLPQDKVRVYVLARELNLESKDLLDLCQKANIDVKNQLSSLDPEQRDLLVEMVRKGGTAPAASAVKPPATHLPEPPKPIRDLGRRPPVAPREQKPGEPSVPVPPVPPPVPVPRVPAPTHEAPPIPPARLPVPTQPAAEVSPAP